MYTLTKIRDWRPVANFFAKTIASYRGGRIFRQRSLHIRWRLDGGWFLGQQLRGVHTSLVLSCRSFYARRGRPKLEKWEEKTVELDSESRSSTFKNCAWKGKMREHRLKQKYMRTRVCNSILWGQSRRNFKCVIDDAQPLSSQVVMHSPLNTCMLAHSRSSVFLTGISGGGLHFACTGSSKYSVHRWAQRSRIKVFFFLFLEQTNVRSDGKLYILPWQQISKGPGVAYSCSYVLLITAIDLLTTPTAK